MTVSQLVSKDPSKTPFGSTFAGGLCKKYDVFEIKTGGYYFLHNDNAVPSLYFA